MKGLIVFLSLFISAATFAAPNATPESCSILEKDLAGVYELVDFGPVAFLQGKNNQIHIAYKAVKGAPQKNSDWVKTDRNQTYRLYEKGIENKECAIKRPAVRFVLVDKKCALSWEKEDGSKAIINYVIKHDPKTGYFALGGSEKSDTFVVLQFKKLGAITSSSLK